MNVVPNVGRQQSPEEEFGGQEISHFHESASLFVEWQWRQFSVSINDFTIKSAPSCRRWKYPVIRLLINREAVRNLPWIPFLPPQNYKIVKTLTPLRKPLDRMAQTSFRWPQRLIKQMLHGLHYIFLWQTLTPPQHVFGDDKPFCVFLFLLPHFHLVTAAVNLC